MSEKKATRNAYGDALVALADRYPQLVVLEADLAGATMTKGFKAAYPQRFFDMGIAESNMQGVAAGLSTCGFKPFTNTFAMFAAGRSWEQVRNSIAYPGMNVKVVGSHGGLSVGEDGATHQCLEDLAAMRSIPGMVVLSPCDANETRLMTKAMAAYDGPCFMRLGRLDVEECTNFVPGYRFEWGKATELYEGTDVTIIATGLMVQESLKARELLAQEGISAAERLEHISREELSGMFYENSDEPYSDKIAKAITEYIRRGNHVDTTTKLRQIIEETLSFLPEKDRKDTVKKTCQRIFQALRIDVNNEFEVLYEFMEKLPNALKPGGRAAILTFHSGEDKLVKKALKAGYKAGIYSEYSKDVVRPSAQECAQNPRARSTKMRWAVKA